MPDTAYDSLSGLYDFLQSESDIRAISGRVGSLIERFGPKSGDGENGRLILCDLGCGTGSVTLQLAQNGYEIIGVDHSPGMLSVAREAFSEAGREALFICQDISRLDLFGTADVFISLTDTLNHLTDRRDFNRLFSRLRCFMNPGGLFIFDLLTLRYLKDIRGNDRYQDISDEHALFWQNRFNERAKLSRADMTLFSKNGEGSYSRADFSVSERYYSGEDVLSAAELSDLELIAVYSGYKDIAARKSDTRRLYVMRRRLNTIRGH